MSARATSQEAGHRFATRARRWLPWLVAALVLGFLFRRVSLDATLAALGSADLRLLIPAATIALLFWFWVDSALLSYLVSRFNAPLSLREARSMRALTYALAVINWHLGTGGIVLHLRHAKGVPIIAGTSTMFLYNLLDGLVLALLALGGLAALPDGDALVSAAWGVGGLAALEAAAIAIYLVPFDPGWRWLARLRNARIASSLARAQARDVILVVAVRVIYFAGFVWLFWVGLAAFGVTVPLAYLTTTVPLVLILGSLPIAPAGLGTQHAAILYFYRAFGPEAALLAFGLSVSAITVLGRLPIAAFYLRDWDALRASLRAAEAPPSEASTHLADER